MHPEYPDGAEVQGVFGISLTGKPKQWVWVWVTVNYRLATPGKHGALELNISWQGLSVWGEKEVRRTLSCGTTGRSQKARYNSVHQRTVWHRVLSGQETYRQRGLRNPTSPRNNSLRRHRTTNSAWDIDSCPGA